MVGDVGIRVTTGFFTSELKKSGVFVEFRMFWMDRALLVVKIGNCCGEVLVGSKVVLCTDGKMPPCGGKRVVVWESREG